MNTRRRRTKSGSKDEKEDFRTGYGVAIDNRQTFELSEGKHISTIDVVDMSCRDRTGEFLSAVKSLQSSQVKGTSYL